MATETAPIPIPIRTKVSAEVLADRWATLMVRPVLEHEGWRLDNSPEYYKLDRWLHRMVRHLARYDLDDETLRPLVEHIHDAIMSTTLLVLDESGLATE